MALWCLLCKRRRRTTVRGTYGVRLITYNVPRMAFINKMDILGANFYGAVEQIKTRLGKNAIYLQPPIGKEDEFKGIIDLFEMESLHLQR